MTGTRAERLSAAFVQAADTLVDDYDVVELLDTLIRDCMSLVEADGGGLVLADRDGVLQVVASSDEEAEFVEINQLNAGEGPCVEAYRTGQPVSIDRIVDQRERWPQFERAATALGFRSMHAFPMRLRGQTIGAMNLFGYSEGDLDSEEIMIAQALTDVATIGILQQRTIEEHWNLAQQLQQALDSRIVIEQAKGVVAAQHGVGMTEAFDVLRQYARFHRMQLSHLAHGVAERRVNLPTPAARGETS